jgi:DNA-binding transcriptional MerR regulator
VELMAIGAFARQAQLSPKALRLYAELGLLVPAHVDPVSGYRFYEPAQLERARLVAWLRRLGMPLARIRVIVALPPAAAGAELAEYWQQAEADLSARRELATFLIGYLSGKDTNEFSRAFCGRLSRSSGRRVSTHGNRSFRGLLTDRAPAGSPVTGLLMGCRARLGVST